MIDLNNVCLMWCGAFLAREEAAPTRTSPRFCSTIWTRDISLDTTNKYHQQESAGRLGVA